MKPLITSDNPAKPLKINEVMYVIDPDQVNTQFPQPQNPSCHQSESTTD